MSRTCSTSAPASSEVFSRPRRHGGGRAVRGGAARSCLRWLRSSGRRVPRTSKSSCSAPGRTTAPSRRSPTCPRRWTTSLRSSSISPSRRPAGAAAIGPAAARGLGLPAMTGDAEIAGARRLLTRKAGASAPYRYFVESIRQRSPNGSVGLHPRSLPDERLSTAATPWPLSSVTAACSSSGSTPTASRRVGGQEGHPVDGRAALRLQELLGGRRPLQDREPQRHDQPHPGRCVVRRVRPGPDDGSPRRQGAGPVRDLRRDQRPDGQRRPDREPRAVAGQGRRPGPGAVRRRLPRVVHPATEAGRAARPAGGGRRDGGLLQQEDLQRGRRAAADRRLDVRHVPERRPEDQPGRQGQVLGRLAPERRCGPAVDLAGAVPADDQGVRRLRLRRRRATRWASDTPRRSRPGPSCWRR